MAFTNSKLVSLTRISPNRNSPRNQPITKITPHHMAGVNSIEQFADIVANPNRQMSANYGIGNDGRIVLTCPEGDRSWCSSSPWNDNRAVTIEVSNSAYGDASGWPIGTAAYNSLINLCVDICKRNGIPKLIFTGDTSGSLTFHYMYAATACPGPWLKAHAQDLCDKVNAKLNAGGGTTEKPVDNSKTYTVSLSANSAIYDTPGGKITGTPGTSGKYTIVEEKKIGYITYGKLKSGVGWVIVKDETPKETSTGKFKTGDLVKIKSGARYYNGGAIPNWVVAENWYISSISGDRAVLGLNQAKNRNIQSPINTKDITLVASTASRDIVKGDKVKVINPIIYGTNKKFTVFVSVYTVLEANGDRVVISSDGKNVTTAIAKSNLQKL